MPDSSEDRSYELALAQHRWVVPERYNIAADVCDGIRGRQLAMVHEHFVGGGAGGALGGAAGPVEPGRATCSPRSGWSAATASRWCCRRRRDGGGVLRDVEARRAPALDVGALRRRGHPPPARRLPRRACSSPTRRTPAASRGEIVPSVLVLDEHTLRRRAGRVRDRSTPRPTIRRSSTTPRARPAWRRASSTPTATCSRHEEFRLLPRRPGRRALPRHGRVGVGGRHLPAARPVATRRGAVRLPARGRLRPAPAARLPLAPPASATCSRPRRRSAR